MRCFYATDPTKPSTLYNVWRSCLTDELLMQFDAEQLNVLTRACVGYIINIYDFNAMTAMLRHLNPIIKSFAPMQQPRKLWALLMHALQDDARVALGIKFMLLRCSARVEQKRKALIHRELRDGNLVENDVAIFYNMENMNLSTPLLVMLKNIPDGKIPSIRMVYKAANECFERNNVYTLKYVNHNLKFLQTSQRISDEDLRNDIFFHCFKSLLQKMPLVA